MFELLIIHLIFSIMKHLKKALAAGIFLSGALQITAQEASENGDQICITPLLNYTNLYTTAWLEDGSGTLSDYDSSGYFNGTIDYEIDSIAMLATERINGGEYHYQGFISPNRNHMFVISTEEYLYSSNTCMKLDPDQNSLPISDGFWGFNFKQTENYGVEVGLYSVSPISNDKLFYLPITGNFDQSIHTLEYTSRSNGILLADEASKVGAINTAGDFFMLADRTTSHQYGIKKSRIKPHSIQGEYYFALWGQVCGEACMPRSALMKVTISERKKASYQIIDDCYGIFDEGELYVSVNPRGLIELKFKDDWKSKIIFAYSPDSDAASGILLQEGKNAILAGFRYTNTSNHPHHGHHGHHIHHCNVDRSGKIQFVNKGMHNICLVDLQGKIVYQKQAEESAKIPSRIKNGLYRLKINDEKGGVSNQNIILRR